jgi:hypothetical protein
MKQPVSKHKIIIRAVALISLLCSIFWLAYEYVNLTVMRQLLPSHIYIDGRHMFIQPTVLALASLIVFVMSSRIEQIVICCLNNKKTNDT